VPRYFFHFSDGTRQFTDTRAFELDGLMAARVYAKKQARELRATLFERHIQDWSGWKIIVTDANLELKSNG
jgi:hypothetical protein